MNDGPSRTGLSVLIVDQDPDMRIYVRRCLAQMRIERLRVLESLDDRAAGHALEEAASVDAVVTEVQAPNHDGIALLARLRARSDWRGIPVLLLSGDPVALEQARRAVRLDPRADVLAKPFNANGLTAALRALLGA